MANDFPTYTDMKRTRVIERDSVYTRPRENASLGSTQPIAKKEGLFDGISIGQIAASAAAAATSMLLASKIGIAGSVIGAAVSSAVTIVATQLYRRALSAGARKLQNATFDAVHKPAGVYGAPEPAQMKAHTPYAQAYTSARSARVAPTKLQARAAAQRAGTQRKVVIASIAIAALSLAMVSGAIMLATAGEGLGTRPNPIFTQSTASTDASAQSDSEASSSTATNSTATNSIDSSTATNGTTSGNTDSSQGLGTTNGSAQTGSDISSSNSTSDSADTGSSNQQNSTTDGTSTGSQKQDSSTTTSGTGSANDTASSSGTPAE